MSAHMIVCYPTDARPTVLGIWFHPIVFREPSKTALAELTAKLQEKFQQAQIQLHLGREEQPVVLIEGIFSNSDESRAIAQSIQSAVASVFPGEACTTYPLPEFRIKAMIKKQS